MKQLELQSYKLIIKKKIVKKINNLDQKKKKKEKENPKSKPKHERFYKTIVLMETVCT